MEKKNRTKLTFRQINRAELDGYFYRGEGNANLVITLPLIKKVLRFRKIKSAETTPSDGGKARVEFEMLFFKKFISKYMGPFVTEHEIILCHPNDIPDWNEKIENFRPQHRKHQISYENYAMKATDFTLLPEYLAENSKNKPTICIEIKPKQGYIPEADRHISNCPYCVKQFYKMAKAMITKRSRYCPCDLFSGENNRVISAIDALVESPQNNFTIFKNGTHVWGEASSRRDLDQLLTEWFSCENNLENLYHLIAEALLRRFPSNHQNSEKFIFERIDDGDKINMISKKKCQHPNGDNLPIGSVLERIYRMQALHSSSAEIVHKIYLSDKKYNERAIFIEDNNDDSQLLRNYLLFRTARDCSIFISFREVEDSALSNIPDEHIITMPDRRRHYVFNIGIGDLDPKTIGQIEKHI